MNIKRRPACAYCGRDDGFRAQNKELILEVRVRDGAIDDEQGKRAIAEAEVKRLRDGIEAIPGTITCIRPDCRAEVGAMWLALRALLDAGPVEQGECYCDPGAQCKPCADRDMARLGKATP